MKAVDGAARFSVSAKVVADDGAGFGPNDLAAKLAGYWRKSEGESLAELIGHTLGSILRMLRESGGLSDTDDARILHAFYDGLSGGFVNLDGDIVNEVQTGKFCPNHRKGGGCNGNG